MKKMLLMCSLIFSVCNIAAMNPLPQNQISSITMNELETMKKTALCCCFMMQACQDASYPRFLRDLSSQASYEASRTNQLSYNLAMPFYPTCIRNCFQNNMRL